MCVKQERFIAKYQLMIKALQWYTHGIPDGGSLAKTTLGAVERPFCTQCGTGPDQYCMHRK